MASASGRDTEQTPPLGMSDALDARQDELMAIASSDGRPPTRWRRVIEWRWFGVGTVLVIAGVACWIAVQGVSLAVIAVGLTLGLLLLVGASPVLAAGLLRGKEEREARKNARIERQGRRDR